VDLRRRKRNGEERKEKKEMGQQRKGMKEGGSEEIFFKKVLGCLAMVSVGDALGMPAHDMTPEEIRARFGGPLRAFHPPFKDSRVHAGMKAGQVTDDTGLTLSLAKAYTENGGKVTPLLVSRYITDWVEGATQAGLGTMIGMSTRQAVRAIQNGADPSKLCHQEKNPMIGATNGGAMKIAPVGLVHPGDMEAVVRDTITVCLPTHGTQTAIAAASAIAAGVSEALSPHAHVFSVIEAVLRGAQRGEREGGRIARRVPLPSVPERIKLAISIVLTSSSILETTRRLSEIVGTGLPAYESVPTAIGIFLACHGDPKKCVITGANIGNDTDTIASMAGALSGALKGFDHVPQEWFQTVEHVNGLNLKATAESLVMLSRRMG
jgi:ADP-ribosylglycohydrolase